MIGALTALLNEVPTPISAPISEVTFDAPANVAFAITAVVMIVAALRVVTTKNIVHAALWLVVVLGGVGINYLLLQAEFVAITQFLVYLGAIVVLFLFGIMLTRAPLGVSDDLDNDQKGIALGAVVLLAGVIGYALIRSYGGDRMTFEGYSIGRAVAAGANSNPRTQALADTIFGQYLIPFEMISVLLLAALIGAIVIARRD